MKKILIMALLALSMQVGAQNLEYSKPRVMGGILANNGNVSLYNKDVTLGVAGCPNARAIYIAKNRDGRGNSQQAVAISAFNLGLRVYAKGECYNGFFIAHEVIAVQ